MPLATAPSPAPFVLVLNPGAPGTLGPIMIGEPSTEPAPLSPVPDAWLRAQAARGALLAELPRPNRGMAARIMEHAPDLLSMASAGSTVGATFLMISRIGTIAGLPEDEPLSRTVNMLGPAFTGASAVLTATVGTAMWLTGNDPNNAPVPLHVFVIEPPPAMQASVASAPEPAHASAFASASAPPSTPAPTLVETQPFTHDPHAIDATPMPQRTQSDG